MVERVEDVESEPNLRSRLPNLGKSLRSRMSRFWYGNVPGTVKPALTKWLQKRWQPASTRVLPPSVSSPDHWIPNRHGISVIQLATMRFFSSLARVLRDRRRLRECKRIAQVVLPSSQRVA